MNDFINMVISHVNGSFASTFMLGILTGWLIEWLFYNFIWKNSRATKKEKDKQIPQQAELTEIHQAIDNGKKAEAQLENEDELTPKTPPKQQKIAKSTSPDDLTQLVGIGPGFAKRLKKIGIDSFQQLSELPLEELMEQLIASGARVNNKNIMISWAEQAKLAADGDFDGLKTFQNELKKG